MPQSQISEENTDNTSSTSSMVGSTSGEDAVRNAASVIVNRTKEEGQEGTRKVRRRSKRTPRAPLISGTSLTFHYMVGILLIFAILLVYAGEPLSKQITAMLARPAPGHAVGPVVKQWWQHAQIPALVLGFLVWLYLTPGLLIASPP